LTTLFRQETENQTTTSTIFNLYAEPVMVESKTGYSSGSHGATPGTTKGRGIKTVGVALVRALNDLLPYNLRPIKARRRGIKKGWGWRVELYYLRRRWHSDGKYRVRKLLNEIQCWNKKVS
jgi:hypothetical protein